MSITVSRLRLKSLLCSSVLTTWYGSASGVLEYTARGERERLEQPTVSLPVWICTLTTWCCYVILSEYIVKMSHLWKLYIMWPAVAVPEYISKEQDFIWSYVPMFRQYYIKTKKGFFLFLLVFSFQRNWVNCRHQLSRICHHSLHWPLNLTSIRKPNVKASGGGSLLNSVTKTHNSRDSCR